MSSSSSSSSSVSSTMSDDPSVVSVVGQFQVGPSTFAELGYELLGGRGAVGGTVLDCHFAATFGCNTMLCVLMWDALTVPDGAIPIHLLWALMFLKVHRLEMVLSNMARVDEKTFRKWTWTILRALMMEPWVSLVDCCVIPT